MSDHLQASFAKRNDTWCAAVKSGQGRSAIIGDQVTVHKANGELKKVTLVALIDQTGDASSQRTSYYSFTEGGV